jgi:hypothetical protein
MLASNAMALAVLASVVLALGVYVFARLLDHASSRRANIVHSLAGGITVAFVMLDLFVELAEGSDEAHAIVRGGPEPVHTTAVLLLVGMIATFVTAAFVAHRGKKRYAVELAPHLGYSLLVGAALVEEAHEGTFALALFFIVITIHLAVVDHGFSHRFHVEHRRWTTFARAIAIVVGALVWHVVAPPIGVFHIVLALVAGGTLLMAFRDEIPSPEEANVGALVAGAAIFTLLQQVRWWTVTHPG